MTDVLAKIVADKRLEVAAARRTAALADLRRRTSDAAPPRDFFGAVTAPAGALRVIAEVKRASPSAGLIRLDFDPVAIAQAYHRNGAAAVSCLTDVKYFQGSLAYIEQIRRAVPLPVLRKDFIIDAWQVYEARAAGADAVLLIAECLEQAELADLLAVACGELGMGCLVEIHEPGNLDRAQRLVLDQPGKALLGVNNRDLKRMVTDLDHTISLLDRVVDRGLLVSESGIRTPADVQRLRDAGVHRILVGEHLMRQPDVGLALRQLMAQP